MGKKCWSCKAEVSPKDFFCKSCKKIQENVDINEFEIFSMEKKVLINLDLLEKNYLELQMTFHPNKFIGLSNREVEISNKYSSKINEAYNTLKNHVSRINLILTNSGVSVINNDETYENNPLVSEIDKYLEKYNFKRVKTKWAGENLTWGDAIYVKNYKFSKLSFNKGFSKSCLALFAWLTSFWSLPS